MSELYRPRSIGAPVGVAGKGGRMTAIRVLHVDDEPDIREVVEFSLGLDPDFTVQGCNSGKEALSVAAAWRPDIILLDVMMSGLDGPATLVQLRQNAETAHFPVVFMTARTGPPKPIAFDHSAPSV